MNYWIQVEDNVSIYVEDINPEAKETVLFVHGWPLSHNVFEYQYNELPYHNIRCIGMDTRGFGMSSRPITGYTYDNLANDLHQVISNLGLKNITLAGHSMGAATAIRYMAKYNQQHVKNLVLIDAAAPSLTRRENFNFGICQSTVNDLIKDASTNRPLMVSNFLQTGLFKPAPLPTSNWFASLAYPAAGYATIQCAFTFRDEVLFRDLEKITVPTLIAHGVHDKIALYSLAVFLRQTIVNSTMIAFEESGHFPFFEEKAKFNKSLLDFINKPTQ